MFCEYQYELDGEVSVAGEVQVEFTYTPSHKSPLLGAGWIDDDAEIVRVRADSMRIVNDKGQVVYEAALIGHQPERIGAEVRRQKWIEIEDVCIQAGREQSTPEAVGQAAADRGFPG